MDELNINLLRSFVACMCVVLFHQDNNFMCVCVCVDNQSKRV